MKNYGKEFMELYRPRQVLSLVEYSDRFHYCEYYHKLFKNDISTPIAFVLYNYPLFGAYYSDKLFKKLLKKQWGTIEMTMKDMNDLL